MIILYNNIAMNISTPSWLYVDMSKTFQRGYVLHLRKETIRLGVI